MNVDSAPPSLPSNIKSDNIKALVEDCDDRFTGGQEGVGQQCDGGEGVGGKMQKGVY